MRLHARIQEEVCSSLVSFYGGNKQYPRKNQSPPRIVIIELTDNRIQNLQSAAEACLLYNRCWSSSISSSIGGFADSAALQCDCDRYTA